MYACVWGQGGGGRRECTCLKGYRQRLDDEVWGGGEEELVHTSAWAWGRRGSGCRLTLPTNVTWPALSSWRAPFTVTSSGEVEGTHREDHEQQRLAVTQRPGRYLSGSTGASRCRPPVPWFWSLRAPHRTLHIIAHPTYNGGVAGAHHRASDMDNGGVAGAQRGKAHGTTMEWLGHSEAPPELRLGQRAR